MKQRIERVRAHHGMCLCFYKGKGYSSDFTNNMWDALNYLVTENPEVTIVDWDDHICASCPNLVPIQELTTESAFITDAEGNDSPRSIGRNSSRQSPASRECTSAEKVARYDRGVLEACGLKSGTRMHWKDYQALVREKVITAGKRELICGDCSWNELCK